jgi:hypothetical protein
VGLPNVREYADPRLLVELAREAEAAGWDGAFVWDHIAREEDPSVPATDPWIAVAAIAARTQRIRLGIMVTPLARRRPWKVAREAVAVDVLCGGRFTLGVGLGGGAQAEFATFGESPDPKVRAELLDEGLAILDGLWSGEPFAFEGTHHTVSGAHFTPRSVQQPRLPIWVAGRWPNRRPFRPVMLRRSPPVQRLIGGRCRGDVAHSGERRGTHDRHPHVALWVYALLEAQWRGGQPAARREAVEVDYRREHEAPTAFRLPPRRGYGLDNHLGTPVGRESGRRPGKTSIGHRITRNAEVPA